MWYHSNMKIFIRNVFTGFSLFALTLFMGNGFLIGQAHAQTASTTSQQGQSDFKHDVDKGVQEVSTDTEAQKNQLEVKNDDNESAGDEHGDVKEIDGENDQSEIDNEIKQEVDQEDAASGQSSDQENGSTSSTENSSSSGVNGN